MVYINEFRLKRQDSTRKLITAKANCLPEVPPPAECEETVDGPDMKAQLPPHLNIAKDVMERCVHLLSDPSLRLRLKVTG